MALDHRVSQGLYVPTPTATSSNCT